MRYFNCAELSTSGLLWLILMLKSRHKRRSFKAAFFALLFIWALLRVIFFAFLINDNNCRVSDYAASEIIYWYVYASLLGFDL